MIGLFTFKLKFQQEAAVGVTSCGLHPRAAHGTGDWVSGTGTAWYTAGGCLP